MKLRLRIVLVVLLAIVLSACAMPTDPCPLPASQHPEAWTATPTLTAAGDVAFWTYVCTGPGVVVR
jgi:ABC-type glycerol-3-phosphate transport system substrate-binding protein